MQHAGRNFLFYLKDSSFSSFHLCSRPPLLIPRLLLAHGILVRWFCHPTDPHSFLCHISKMVRPKLTYPTMWGTPAMFVGFKIQLTTVTSLISPQWTQTFTLSYVRQLGYHPPSAINPIKRKHFHMFLMVKSPFSYGFPMVFHHPKQPPEHEKPPFFSASAWNFFCFTRRTWMRLGRLIGFMARKGRV